MWRWRTWDWWFEWVMGSLIVGVIAMMLWAFVLLFSQWYEGPIVEGIVLQHQHHDAYITTSYVLVGKVMVPQTQYWPESWAVLVRGVTARGKLVERWVSVNYSEYQKLRNGERFKPR